VEVSNVFAALEDFEAEWILVVLGKLLDIIEISAKVKSWLL
jgi:hypothetical protein